MNIGILPVYVYVNQYVLFARGSQKRPMDSLEVDFTDFMSCHFGTGN